MKKRLLNLTLLLTLISGCAYEIEIQQGNIITTAQVEQLKIGMDQQRVRFIMGTPLLQDPFHQQRWDYIFELKSEERQVAPYRVTLYFEKGLLKSIEKSGELPESPIPKALR
ncbi:MAG: outer membrane protein assembly factor BamE [Gammaproteobacteria bacterium]|nr:outer membrane protein assembly factor BamE [Gammaproteobacteria bacterium]MCW8982978.1 outer membrane protein assembly factor BamE [Gammaproteobacteria bacterium]